MPIQNMTDASERQIWYNHPLTVELREELQEAVDQILEAWKMGSYVAEHSAELSHTANLTALANFQVLQQTLETIKALSEKSDEEEDDYESI